LSTPLDAAILFYAAAYLLSMINAVHPGEAFWGFLKALNYFLIYMLVAQVVPDMKSVRVVIKTLFAAAVGVAVIGLLAATGYSQYPGAFVENHIMSTLQYHNTTAAYLGAMCFAGFALLLTTSDWSRKQVYAGAVYLLALVTVTAISKGALLTVMAAAIVFFIGTPRRYKIIYLYNLIYLFAIAFLTSSFLMGQITGDKPAGGIIVILTGLLLALLIQPLGEKILHIFQTRNFKKTAVSILMLLIISLALLTQIPAGERMMPENLTKEIMEIADLSDPSYVYRADFIRWGISIARDYPLTGSGAGGWEALMQQYQDYLYFAADAHNHVIQLLVETGVAGVITYIAIWVFAVMAVIKFSKRAIIAQNDTSLILMWGAFAAATALGLHALIDFDFSIPAVFILLIALLALINQICQMGDQAVKKQMNSYQLLIPTLLALILLLAGSCLSIGNIYADRAKDQLSAIDQNSDSYSKKRETAITNLKKSVIFDPLNAEARINLSRCYASLYLDLAGQKIPGAAEAYQNTLDAITTAEKLMPNDAEIINGALNSAVTIGNLDTSLRIARRSVKIGPNNSSNYQTLGEVLYAAASYYIETGDKTNAEKMVKELLDLPSVISRQQKLSNQERISAHMGRPLKVTEELAEIIENSTELQSMLDISSTGKEGS
ncbi:MAG: O-antigen ligase family protein, partial [Syntrophomonadaceae bacterium]|nr:O-antigen ligase family protein [Syntrophomonadaceae bacterium]